MAKNGTATFVHLSFSAGTTSAGYIQDFYDDINLAYSHMNSRVDSWSGGKSGAEYMIEECEQ